MRNIIRPIHWKRQMLLKEMKRNLQISGETSYDHRWESSILLRYQLPLNCSVLQYHTVSDFTFLKKRNWKANSKINEECKVSIVKIFLMKRNKGEQIWNHDLISTHCYAIKIQI